MDRVAHPLIGGRVWCRPGGSRFSDCGLSECEVDDLVHAHALTL
jgi:hypothetical protein